MKYTIKELKKLIKDVPDDTIVVTDGSDHSYSKSRAEVVDAWQYEDGDLCEYYGPEYESGSGKVVKVLHIG